MKAHLQAVDAMLAPVGVDCEIVAATPNKLPPYYVLTPLTPTGILDTTLDVGDHSLAFDLRLTAVAGTSEGALDLLSLAKAILAPNDGPSFPVVAGRSVSLWWERFESDYVDTSVVIPDTNRNPALAVDTYALFSEPTS